MVERMSRTRVLAESWKAFVETGRIGAAVRPEIARSWLRCRQAGIDPRSGISRAVLHPREIQELLARKSDLIAVARPLMDNLYRFVAGSGFIVMLSDERGYIMEVFGDKRTMASAASLNVVPGASWAEEEAGTNGLGTALAIGGPVQVSGEEHFCRLVHGWTCSSAPIRSDAGQVIGALQMSGPSARTHLHTLGMVVAAVAAIEEQLRVRRRNQELTLLNSRLSNILSTVSDGVVVVDGQGGIVEVNPAAERLLKAPGSEMKDVRVFDILERTTPVQEMLDAGSPFQDVEIRVTTGRCVAQCLCSGQPIADESGRVTGGVIFLNPINKVRNLVNRFSGAQAAFHFEDIIGRNGEILEAIRLAKLAARRDSNILLQGESGTGKEVFAQSIHNLSPRRDGPFIAVNCGAIPRELIGSELFGYEEGAFTGAQRGGRPGKFELAAGGTLFLDEIGEMPLEHQVALLRVLQDRQVTRIGGGKVTVVDVRIICSSNRDLRLEVARGNFREDLYYRLNVITIRLPALRDRKEDIPILFDAILGELCRRMAVNVHHVDPRILECLQRYDWPGNLREFQNVVECMVNVAAGDRIGIEHLPEELLIPWEMRERGAHSLSRDTAVGGAAHGVATHGGTVLALERQRIKSLIERQEREEILSLLAKNRGNMSQVSRDLGISRNSLYRKLRRLNISI